MLQWLKEVAGILLGAASVGAAIGYLLKARVDRKDFERRTRYPKLYELRAGVAIGLARRLARTSRAIAIMLDPTAFASERATAYARAMKVSESLERYYFENRVVLPSSVSLMGDIAIAKLHEVITGFRDAHGDVATSEPGGIARAREAQSLFEKLEYLLAQDFRKLLDP
ncbi:MAG TPA: hypothetical protein VEA69_10455 [Tepidisphaeraceae bacterium]|nr:hypothetical protein [Tepidisphaeraceae bacterium]